MERSNEERPPPVDDALEDFRSPRGDAMASEADADRSGAAYGEADRRDPPEPDLEREPDSSSVD